MISGALFLYFHRKKVVLPLHPSVSTHLTGANPADRMRVNRTKLIGRLSTVDKLFNSKEIEQIEGRGKIAFSRYPPKMMNPPGRFEP
jgi:hypothetical protein